MSRRFSAGPVSVFVVFGPLICTLAIALSGRDAQADVASTVNGLHALLAADTRSAGTQSVEERRKRVNVAIRSAYAVKTMAQTRVGSGWSGLSMSDQNRIATALAAWLVERHLGAPARGRLQLASQQALADGGVRARTKAASGPGGTPVEYELRQVGGGWAITNEWIGGRDQNADERRRWAPLLAQGVDALVRSLQKRSGSARPPPSGGTATSVVERLQNALLGVMRDATRLGFKGRYQRLDRIVRETHYIAAIARLTIRRHWSSLGKAQQQQLVTTFGELSVSNYASKFDGYKGERFVRTKEEKVGKSTVVRTQIIKSNGEAVRLDYTLRQVKGRWRILNITADGVSDLSTKQAEYGSVMASSGFNGLITKLRAQIQRYQSGR